MGTEGDVTFRRNFGGIASEGSRTPAQTSKGSAVLQYFSALGLDKDRESLVFAGVLMKQE